LTGKTFSWAGLLWFAGLVFVFAAANKNDPYLIALRGVGNVVLTMASLVAFLVLIRHNYWSSRGIAGKLLVLLWGLPSLAMLGAHLSFEVRKRNVLQTIPRKRAASVSISSWDIRRSMR
jgi:beta-N-acetylhexosaminidase